MPQTPGREPDLAAEFWSYLARKAGLTPARAQKAWRAIRHSPEVHTWRYVLAQALTPRAWPPPDPLRRGPCRPAAVVEALEWAVLYLLIAKGFGGKRDTSRAKRRIIVTEENDVMTDDRSRQIEQAIADLESQGITSWTYQQVYQVVRGNFPEVATYLRDRRAAQSADSPAEIPEVAPASVATQDLPAPSTAAIATPPADPERAARLAQKRAAWRALQAAQAAAPPAPPAPPAPRRSVPYEPVSVSIHYPSPPPVWHGGSPPVKDTRPTLVIAREEVQRSQELVNRASSQARPLEADIARFQARQTQLTTDRKTVQTVEELRCVKAELLAIEEELEILQRQYAPLAQVVRSLGGSLRQAADAYGQVRAQAIEALDRARTQHFHGESARDKQKRFQELVALVGAEDLQRYVTDLSHPAECREAHNTPPWKR